MAAAGVDAAAFLAVKLEKVGAHGWYTRMQGRYEAYLPALSHQDRENLRTILAGMVLPTLHGHSFCKNCTCAGCI